MADPFVFDGFDGGLVVMPLREAQRLAALNDAIESSSTWGEFLTGVSGEADTMTWLRTHYEEGLPASEKPFDPDELPGFVEGDWPLWPKRGMLEWLPDSVRVLGIEKTAAFGPSFLHLDEDQEDEVIDALAAERIECRWDTEDLIRRACGEWRYA